MSKVHPAFKVSEEQAAGAFASGEQEGRSGNQDFRFKESRTLTLREAGGRPSQPLELYAALLTPLERARLEGYKFGLVAKTRAEADRNAVLNAAKIMAAGEWSQEIAFYVALGGGGEVSAWFGLVVDGGRSVAPSRTPNLNTPKTLPGDMADNLVVFPVYDGATPNVTEEMSTVKLEAGVNGGAAEAVFNLRG